MIRIIQRTVTHFTSHVFVCLPVNDVRVCVYSYGFNNSFLVACVYYVFTELELFVRLDVCCQIDLYQLVINPVTLKKARLFLSAAVPY